MKKYVCDCCGKIICDKGFGAIKGYRYCMLELEEEFDWDKIAGRLKIHKGGNA